MHILYLHQYFCPPDGAGGTRSYAMARRLVESGHKVTIVTTSAFFPDNYALARKTRLSIDGINLVVLKIPYGNTMGFLKRIWAFLRFAIGGLWVALKVKNVDIVFATSTPLTIIIPGYISSRVHATPLVFEVRDLWPDLPIAVGALKNPVAKWLARRLETFAYRSAARIVALSPGMKEGVIGRGISDDKVVMIPNASDVDLFRVSPEAGHRFLEQYPHLRTGPLVTYAGTLGRINAVEYMVDLAQAMLSINPSVRFVICGDGGEREYIRAKAAHVGVLDQNLWMLPPLPKNEMPNLLSASTVALSLFQNLPEMQHNSANKVFDALAAGKPVIVNYGGWQAELLESRSAGLALPPENIGRAAQDLSDFLHDTDGLFRAGEQAAALADSRFNRDRLAGQLRDVLEDAVTREPAARKLHRRTLAVKSIFDRIAAAIGLVLLSPVLLVIAGFVFFKMGWPVFFTQLRPGLKGVPFRLIKFRTMADETDSAGALLPDAERLTRTGQFLRRTSLDELPELINVLLGDMSLVGPRPLLMEYLPHYSTEQARRHDVLPGITGYAQVHGRNALNWEEKFSLDTWYVDNMSFALDLKILLQTIGVVLGGKGVSASNHVTMPRFDEIMARKQGAEDD